MRRTALAAGAAVSAALALAGPAWADVLVLRNADHLAGRLDVTELPLATPGGVSRLSPGAVRQVELDTLAGDVVTLRSGAVVTGHLDLAGFVIRLDSGHEVSVSRYQVAELRFLPR